MANDDSMLSLIACARIHSNSYLGSDPVEAAVCFYKGLKVYPEPSSLIQIYDNTIPKHVLEILAQLVSLDKDLKVGSFGQSRDSGSESGHGVE